MLGQVGQLDWQRLVPGMGCILQSTLSIGAWASHQVRLLGGGLTAEAQRCDCEGQRRRGCSMAQQLAL